jgi:predicted dehydrogenase
LQQRGIDVDCLRVVLIGVGQIGVQSHLPAILGHPGWSLVAMCDPRVEAVRRIGQRFGTNARVVSDFREVLADCDAAIIATPNASHAEIASACLDRGVHVLIEKPMATTLSDAQAIVEAGARSGRIIAVGNVTRFRANIVLLKRLLDEDRFGRVRRFYHQFGTQGGWAPESGYATDARRAGGGVLAVTGTHFLDRLLHFWGMPETLDYADDAYGGPEAHCEIAFGFDTGLRGMARYSKLFPMSGRLVLDTEGGVVALDDTDDAEIVYLPADLPRTLNVIREPDPGRMDPFWLQVDDFRTAIIEHRPPRVDAAQGLMSARLLDWAYRVRRDLDFGVRT